MKPGVSDRHGMGEESSSRSLYILLIQGSSKCSRSCVRIVETGVWMGRKIRDVRDHE